MMSDCQFGDCENLARYRVSLMATTVSATAQWTTCAPHLTELIDLLSTGLNDGAIDVRRMES